MSLAGEITTIGLAEVFQNLAFNQASGTLILKEADRKAQLLFEDGRILAVRRSDTALDYGDIARRAEVAPPEAIEKAMSVRRRRTLKAYLRASGEFDETAYDTAVANQVEDLILPLFGWTAGAFQFDEGAPKPRAFEREQLGCAIDLDPQGVAMEAARRQDEWQTIAPFVPSDRTILVPTGAVPAEELNQGLADLLALLDGTRDVAGVLEQSRLKKYDLHKALAWFVETGLAAPATAERMLELATQARAAGDIHLAASRLELVVELDPADGEARRELARLYQRAGRQAEAGRTLRALAELQSEQGDLEGALESCERAAVLAPGDLDLGERIFQFHEALGDQSAARKAGRRLAEALVAQEMYEDALPLYERLLETGDRNVALREALARCLVAMGETDRAVEHLLLLAKRAFEGAEFERAREYYASVLGIDEACEEAAGRLAEIDSGRAAARRRRRRRLLIWGAVALVAGLAFWQVLRESAALDALHAAGHVSATELGRRNEDRDRVAAMRRYAEVGRDFALTRGGALARETLATLLSAEVAAIGSALEGAASARTTADVEYTLGRARKLLRQIENVPLPADLYRAWEADRDRLTARVAQLLSN